VVEAASLLAPDLAPAVSDALATLAARMSVPTLLFGAIFVPSANLLVDEGPVPGRPDMAYRWAHDETSVTFSALVDGGWRTLAGGAQIGDAFLDENGEPVAVAVRGPDNRWTLVASVDVLDRALADLKSGTGEPDAARSSDDDEPKLCPDPAPEPKTTTSQNSIAYQEYVSKLPYGLAIRLGGVMFDGCDPATGDLLEAKADIDFMFGDDDELNGWVYEANNPKYQMLDQAEAALADGRRVVWHAQTLKGFRGLSAIANRDLIVVYDPN
jgi:Restriction endonuclease fold toxin 5